MISEEETQDQNPHLPIPPADGKHDLEGSTRCRLCGAYGGSPEAEKPCRGRWAESGKMRSHAAKLWMEDRLLEGGPALNIILSSSRQIMPTTLGRSVQFGTSPQFFITLACGHEREVGYLVHETPRWGYIAQAACVDPNCPYAARMMHVVLNPSWQPAIEALAEAERALRGRGSHA